MPLPRNVSYWWFVLGREPMLSAAEIAAVLSLKNIKITPTDKILRVVAPKETPAELIKKLGGTVRIGQELSVGLKLEQLKETIKKELLGHENKVNFGISWLGQESEPIIKKLGLTIKKELRAENISARYVPSEGDMLNAATIKGNKLIDKGFEFLICQDEDGYGLAKTLAIQPFAEFSERDYGRPGRDNLSGMLPPKLAMMMINLAEVNKKNAVLDPFCGSGTILSEAMLLGYTNLTGSDISEKAIKDTKINLDWLNKELNKVKLFTADATEISKQIKSNSVNSIITEPYLGQPRKGNEPKDQIEQQATELKQLYLASLKEFYKILKPGGQIVFIVPCFKIREGWVRVIKNEVEIEKIGFTFNPLLPNCNFLRYWRPGQFVGREVWRFKKS